MKRVRKRTTTTKGSSSLKRLSREFYDQNALELCESLLGKVLTRKLPHGEIIRGTIVETEAYPGQIDPASASFSGKRTEKNAAMFMDPGTSYVYFTYGMYYCFNVSSAGNFPTNFLKQKDVHNGNALIFF